MMPYGTTSEVEAALGRSMTWAETWWFRYSATMPDLLLMWHIAIVYFTMYALVPLPLLILQQVAPNFATRYKLQPGVPQQSQGPILRYVRDNACVMLFVMGPFPLIYSTAFKVFINLLIIYSAILTLREFKLHRNSLKLI
jgi:hypothetical protein